MWIVRPWISVLGFASFVSCTSETSHEDSGGDTAGAPLEFLYAYVVVADPHIGAPSDHDTRLEGFVDWVNTHREEESIELVLVLGDVGWDEGLPNANAMLDLLDVPYAPLIGDNEVHSGLSADFVATFAAAFDVLESEFEDFRSGIGTAWDPVVERDITQINFAFTHRGVRFVCLDWTSRSDHIIDSEMGNLHDHEGGTLPWFAEELAGLDGAREGSVVLASHNPMALIPGGFYDTDQAVLEETIAPYASLVPYDYAGHLHVDMDLEAESGDYEVRVVDALWDDDESFRLIEVWGNDERIETVEIRHTL